MYRPLPATCLCAVLAATGCSDPDPAPDAAVLANPEPPAVEIEAVEAEPLEPAPENQLRMASSVVETALGKLDEMKARHATLTASVANSERIAAVAGPSLERIGGTIEAARSELAAIDVDAHEPGTLQELIASRLQQINEMLDDAAALIDETKSAPTTLPPMPEGPPAPPPSTPK